MLGSSVTTQIRQTRFMNNFEEFKAKEDESLKVIFDRISSMQIQEFYEILMTDECIVTKKKAKLDKKNKKTVDSAALLTSRLADQALSDNAYDGATEDDGEALQKAMILLSQHYQKKYQPPSSSNTIRFTSGSKNVQVPEANVVTAKKATACFNCGKSGHIAKECRAKVVRDSAYYRKKLELAENRENGTALLAKEEFWLNHSEDEADNIETAPMCFIGDDQSDEDSTTDDDEVSSVSDFKFISSPMNIIITALHDLRSKTLSTSSKQIWRVKRTSDDSTTDEDKYVDKHYKNDSFATCSVQKGAPWRDMAQDVSPLLRNGP
ncbi:hypothetical protein L6452_40626 [Arctium lappa]|uniref:Uncharacterized protein n=1 Tax=Arctium lappa TaxID=4217 RepID=A0ACB8XLT4_ARCLA|nr:hypothetical protein L6452_40626 [Arctium lappa]